MQKKKMPNYQGSLRDYKDSMNESPSPTYPEGFTPYPEGFTPYPKGFTPGASVPKAGDSKKPKPKKNSETQDPSTVRKMQDRLKVVVAEFDKQSAWVNEPDQGSLMKLGSEIDKLQRGIMRARKNK